MNRKDLIKLIGAESGDVDYLPVAFLLRTGYACAGFYNAKVNEDFSETCVLLNAHLIELKEASTTGHRPKIEDFGEFLEEVVVSYYESKDAEAHVPLNEAYGKSIPLTAIPFDEIAVIYPVAHIESLMRRAKEQRKTVAASTEPETKGPRKEIPTFLDFDKSEILGLLRTKLW